MEICDECGKKCSKVYLSKFADVKEVPKDWFVCKNCITEETTTQ